MFLVAVSDHVNSGDSEEVARAVLQEKYQVCSYHLLQTIHSSFCVLHKKRTVMHQPDSDILVDLLYM